MNINTYLGNVISVAFNYAPADFLPCDGRLLQINQYEALYTLMGTVFGGDGVQTFGLPDLRGRAPVHMGQGTGLSNYVLGQKAGTSSVTMTSGQLPAHTHGTSQMKMQVNTTSPATTNNPAKAYLSMPDPSLGNMYTPPGGAGVYYGATATPLSPVGNSLPIDIRNPFVAINYIICVQGLFPTRS